MKQYRVVISPHVYAKIMAQLDYIAEDSLTNAVAWHDRLLNAIEALGEHAGFTVDEEASERVGHEVRRMVFERTYLVFYRVDEVRSVVEVENFRHGMRLPREGEP